MSRPDEPRLSRLSTRWSLVLRAHGADPAGVREAQAELLPRYTAAIYRYVAGMVRDEATAEEVCQEFAYRFARGDFRHARPERGRFRDYVKAAVVNLVCEHRRRQGAERLVPFDSSVMLKTADPEGSADDRLVELWRESLLARAWEELERASAEGRLLLHEVLWLKAEDPSRRSADIAAELERRHGRPFTPANARQMLHRAREKFVELLWQGVAESLPSDDPAAVRAELAELGLLAYFEPEAPGPGGD